VQDEDLEKSVVACIQNVAAVCLAANYPTLASVPHSLINAYKDNVLALGVMLEDYTFPQVFIFYSYSLPHVCYKAEKQRKGKNPNSKYFRMSTVYVWRLSSNTCSNSLVTCMISHHGLTWPFNVEPLYLVYLCLQILQT
jgi:hypothetical protein